MVQLTADFKQSSEVTKDKILIQWQRMKAKKKHRRNICCMMLRLKHMFTMHISQNKSGFDD